MENIFVSKWQNNPLSLPGYNTSKHNKPISCQTLPVTKRHRAGSFYEIATHTLRPMTFTPISDTVRMLSLPSLQTVTSKHRPGAHPVSSLKLSFHFPKSLFGFSAFAFPTFDFNYSCRNITDITLAAILLGND